jgi:D-alanyl-D-alanine carboxypeptidase
MDEDKKDYYRIDVTPATKPNDIIWKFFVYGILVLAVLFLGSLGKKQFSNNQPTGESVFASSQKSYWDFLPAFLGGQEKKPVIVLSPYDGIELIAKSAYVWDVENQKALFTKNEDTILPIASITKLMTTIVALDNLSKFAIIKVSPDSLRADGDTGLLANEKWKLEELLKFSLTNSSNDGMSAVASSVNSVVNNDTDGTEQYFVQLMNEKAKSLGLLNSNFNNSTGLDLSFTVSGGYSTSREISKLMEYAVKKYPDILESTTQDFTLVSSLSNVKHLAKNTNEVVDDIPNIIASKTGYTDLAGGNLTIAFDMGLSYPIIITVLGSDREGRFSDILKLVLATQKLFLARNMNI